ncbi:5518_t:CDS:2, partial [Racocetra persica]
MAQKREETEAQIYAKLSLLETQLNVLNNIEVERSTVTINEDPQDSLSAKLWGSLSLPNNITAEDEFTQYMKELLAHKNKNPLIYQLAYKYLSISAISVSSKCLFSDMNTYISARKTCLDPNL